jgi:2,5-diamino-6-(ribosylamino)-4(3H)-pyrimidinone 5'-phosphate reductase
MNRPYIQVNVAMSADGKIDTAARKGAAFSSEEETRRVDELRASVDAVLVGGKTLLSEDPKLTVRSAALRAERLDKGWPGDPAKVGVVSEIPSAGVNLQQFLSTGPARRLIFTTGRSAPEELARLEQAGAEVFVQDSEQVDLAAMLESLHGLGIRRLMVEGGGTLIAAFFNLGFVDELTIYIAPKIFGGASAPTLADGPGFLTEMAPKLKLLSVEKFDDEGGVLLHYQVATKAKLNE